MAPTFNNFHNKDIKKDTFTKRKYNEFNKDKEEEGPQYLDNKEKRERKAERKSQRKNASLIQQSKAIWIQLTNTSNTKAQISEFMTELMKVITNNIKKLVLQHDASRIIQAAVKFGNVAQRKIVLYELEDILFDMMNSKYGRFVVCKLIQTLCDKGVKDSATYRKVIIKVLKGHVSKIAYHKFGSQVLNDIYKTFPSKDYNTLKEEFYSRQYTFLSQDKLSTTTLESLIKLKPDKRTQILASQNEIIQKAMDKELLNHFYFHDLLHDYLSCLTNEELYDNELLSNLASSHAIPLLASKKGTLVFCKVCFYGNSKDRKSLVKELSALKEGIKEYALHKNSFLALLTLFQVMDDTKASGKILKNLFVGDASAPTRKEEDEKDSPLLEIALHDIGSKLFFLLLPDDYASSPSTSSPKKYFEANEQEYLFHSSNNSKKDAEIRRQELCAYVQEDITNMCMQHTYELITSKIGSLVLREVYNSFPSAELMDAIINAYKIQDEENKYYLFEDPKSHLFIKNIFLSECTNKKDTRAYYKSKAVNSLNIYFAKKFYDAFKGELSSIVGTNRGAFVISALCDVEVVKDDVKKELDGCKEVIRGLVGEKENGGHACLLRCLDG